MTDYTIYLVLLICGAVAAVPAALKEDTTESVTVNCVKCHNIDTEKINVHLVPHSHDDVGWLKTVDQYYYGLNNGITTATVHYIITTVVQALEQNSDRRFIQVETAFYWLWWKTQDENLRQRFKKLVDNGQIEIVNAALSMNDEACVNYQSTIDQFTWGLKIIQDTLGQCGRPTVGWQIDPFGHSREQASLIASIGFDGVFFARLDSADREKRMQTQAMDFAWQGSANLENSEIFGGIFPTSIYYPPNGFCFDIECGDDSIVEDEESVSYNLKDKMDLFRNYSKEYVKYYPTKNIMLPMGGDFQYMSAEKNFDNMDKLIKAFINDSEINVFYSTPSCYIQAVNSAQPNLKLKTDDFFPYSSANNSFWAGYFTSRQNFKRFERSAHNVLQVAKQLVTISRSNTPTKNFISNLTMLREVMGVVQHHDAITGTEKDHVTKDYVRQLTTAVEQAEAPFGEILSDLISKNISEVVSFKFQSCHLANTSICDVSQNNDSFVVIVYNPLAWTVDYIVRLPVEGTSYNVTGTNGQVDNDVVDPISEFSYVKLDQTPSAKELVFAAQNIPRLGVQVYYVKKLNSSDISDYSTDDWVFGNDNVKFEINNKTNALQSVTMNNKTLSMTQAFYYYKSHNGTNETDASGAYIFRPQGVAKSYGDPTIISKIKGKVVHEVKQKFGDYITQIIRVYTVTQDHVQFDWLVGPVDISDKYGTEVITRFTVDDFDSNSTFYTDSNGREQLTRVLNSRPDYTYIPANEPIASNYYPVTSKIVIKDNKKNLEVAVLNDRSQGGTSLNNGELELMVHRRTVKDDSKGVDEALNQTEFGIGVVARGQHYLVFGSASEPDFGGKTTAAHERITAQKKLLQPWLGLAAVNSETNLDYLKERINFTASFLQQDLPENVNILTLEPWANESYLVRLEHIMEQTDDPVLSGNVNIDLQVVFDDSISIMGIEEVGLAADRSKAARRYTWNHTADSTQMDVFASVNDSSNVNVTLTPMQIRTFIIKTAISGCEFYQPSLLMIFLSSSLLKIFW